MTAPWTSGRRCALCGRRPAWFSAANDGSDAAGGREQVVRLKCGYLFAGLGLYVVGERGDGVAGGLFLSVRELLVGGVELRAEAFAAQTVERVGKDGQLLGRTKHGHSERSGRVVVCVGR